MKRILLDTNIILDIILKRESHFDNAVRIFSLMDQGAVYGFVSATTITDIYYISRKGLGHEAVLEFLSNLFQIVDVLGVDGEVVRSALHADIADFEDAIQVIAAVNNGIDAIVTRNVKDFAGAAIPAHSPKEFIKQFG